MKRLLFIPTLTVAALLVIAASGSAPQLSSGRLKFSHLFHVQEAGVECAQCHSGVEASSSGRDRLIPGMDVCATCHDVESESGCISCHPDPNNIIPAPAAGHLYEAFSHKAHTAKATCEKCHQLQTGAPTTRGSYPAMKDCAECHAQSAVDLTCARCHTAGMPPPPLSHRVDWTHRHGEDARFERADCATCHEGTGAPTTCVQCHQGAEFGSPHPRNFVHSTAYIRGGGFADCQSCHEAESFCATCHQQTMVLPSNHSRAGWATPSPSAGGLHARKGEADMESCLICHAALTKQPSCFSAGCHQ